LSSDLNSTSKNLELIIKKTHLETSYESWVKNFSLNLSNIWNENSGRDLDPSVNSVRNYTDSAIVIGAGPSLKKYKHLELLANSNFKGSIICTDRSLIPALKAGVTPDKFPNFFVATIDTDEKIKNFYDDDLIKKYSNQIYGLFTTVTNPLTVDVARKQKILIHWIHALFDYEEGKKSFNRISALMTRAKNHINGLPAIQTGGNVGTSCWFIAWKILKCKKIALIGIDHSWNEQDSWETILSHSKIPLDTEIDNSLRQKLFPKINNPEFNCTCVLDPIFQYYSTALKEFIQRSPLDVTTINATEGGCIFGDRITCLQFSDFLKQN
jgi:hypothetical protein